MTNMFPAMKIIIVLTIFFCFALLQISAHTLYNSNNIMTEKKVESDSGRPTWLAKTKGYEKYIFYCGRKCAEDFLVTSRELGDHIRTTYGPDAYRSMIEGDIKIEGMVAPTMYDTKADMDAALGYSESVV